jgi:hypothetical protein
MGEIPTGQELVPDRPGKYQMVPLTRKDLLVPYEILKNVFPAKWQIRS